MPATRRPAAKKSPAKRSAAKKSATKKGAATKSAAKRPAATPKPDRAEKDAIAVEAFMAELDHPRKADVEALRKVMRASDPRIRERVKWKAPSYHIEGEDLAAFNLWQREFLQLVLLFPHGVVADPKGILEGEWKDRRTVRFDGAADVRKKKAALAAVVKEMAARAR